MLTAVNILLVATNSQSYEFSVKYGNPAAPSGYRERNLMSPPFGFYPYSVIRPRDTSRGRIMYLDLSLRLWRPFAVNRNLPCIMPFGEGFLPTLTLNHSLRRLDLGNFFFCTSTATGFTAEVFHFLRRVITSRCRCVFVLAVGVRRQICPAGYE